ncbi:MAG TPA: sigma-70 family RNA polymerase sigma factor [Verrucomicrobiae bacterium]|nr:sigma-70 family RNA polymerase sigma factor [Verrucomicrobiae bacterium]
MTSDLDLLEKFVRENSQAAFSEIVRRHLNLVYSAALRQVRSPQLAEEIAQSVFADLARNAGKMSGTGVPPVSSLTPWLYAVTRRTAIDVIRKESRRQLREQIAVEMHNMDATQNDWRQIEPLLDDAMAALEETDRSAVLLRYFENKSLREVGEALGASEDAAQKRVGRAVDRLREFFSKRNVTIGAGGLVVLISANAVQSAPVGLAVSISAAALAGTAISTSTAIAATKVIAMTTLQKTLVTATVAVLAGTGIYEMHQTARLREQNQRLEQQLTPLSQQMRGLERERDEATNRLAGLQSEIAQLKSNSNEMELLKLRAEVTRLRALEDENNNLRMKLSELQGRWFNVTNAPQYSGPYFPRGKWKIFGNGDPLEILLTAATAATNGDAAKLSELLSNTNSLSLFSKRRWDNVNGIQNLNVRYINNNGKETAVLDTILMRAAITGEQIDPNQPPALTELMQTAPESHRWYFSKTEDGWKITGGD